MFDVGVPGNISDIKIWDSAGLTDHLTARFISKTFSASDQATLMERYNDPSVVWCLRYEWEDSNKDPADNWLKETLPSVLPSRSGNNRHRWRCRTNEQVSTDIQTKRWQSLIGRYPSQDGFRWYLAHLYAKQGHLTEATNLLKESWYLSHDHAGWFLFGDKPSEYKAGRGWPLYSNGQLVSLELPADRFNSSTLYLDVDDPGEDGAKVSVDWDNHCADTLFLTIYEPTQITLPSCSINQARKLIVSFLNDTSGNGFDRNVYVSVSIP